MSEAATKDGLTHTAPDTGQRMPGQPGPGTGGKPAGTRKRRGLRIALISLGSVFALVLAVAVGGVLAINHLASNIKRIHVSFAHLTAAEAAGQGAMNVVITGAGLSPGGAAGATAHSGLIMILHINANHQAGGVISLPPRAVVNVPGFGRHQLQAALTLGGPSLLVKTIQQVSENPVEHYAAVDFSHVNNVINAEGGVNVTLPAATTSDGYTFHAGVNHLSGARALAYARQPSLTEEGRVLREQSLMRAVLSGIAHRHLLSTGTYGVLNAITSMLTVDSNLSNSQITSLATELKSLSAKDSSFVTAATQVTQGRVQINERVCEHLWAAMRSDSIATFASQYPSTVTPSAVP